ncbi:MAG TPA: L-aspartate oxidase [Armatimonadota bacterium]|nr:L-aspartate oxidase [Armatimonadota bacterium]
MNLSTGEDAIYADVLVLGGGIAGGTAAIKLAQAGIRVALVNMSPDLRESNTGRAQGGIVARGPADSTELLEEDILEAGDRLCNPAAVQALAQEGPPLVEKFLIDELGVEFSHDDTGELDFTQEAAHSRRRILHATDATGWEIQDKLVRGMQNSNVALLANHTAVDLLTLPHHATDPLAIYSPRVCVGCYVLDNATGQVQTVIARRTLLATGGLGQIFLHTTNPRGARGDGLAMAHRAGADIMNAEYVQFHPTALYVREANRFLISESVRGEGARLKTVGGHEFMQDYDVRGDLAPRDIVARAIHEEMLRNGDDYVLLDLAGHADFDIAARFPTIYKTCLRFGVDITRDPIPVVPAAHYFCGGVKVDLWGLSTLPGLYAAGEVACTGLHGANRLASTSLLEGLVWGARAAKHMVEHQPVTPEVTAADVRPWHDEGLERESDPALVAQDWLTIRNTMWNYAGIVRTGRRLTRAMADLSYLAHRIEQFYRQTRLDENIIGLRNGVEVAQLVVKAALLNPVSRGCHFRKQ